MCVVGRARDGVIVPYCCTTSRYQEYIKESVYRSLPQAQLGGVPGIFQLVRSYLTIQQTSATPGLEVGSGEEKERGGGEFYVQLV